MFMTIMLPEELERKGFEAVRFLGEGATGIVYEVKRRGARVALKYSGLASIQQESRLLAALGPHPNVIATYERGKAGKYYWYTMEMHSGDLLYWAPRRDLRLTPKTVVRQALQGLVHLHQQGIVHGDAHLGNFGVIWDKGDRPRVVLTDLDLARRFRDAKTDEILTDVLDTPKEDLYRFLGQFEDTAFHVWTDEPQPPLFPYLVEAATIGCRRVLDYLFSLVRYDRSGLADVQRAARRNPDTFALVMAWSAALGNQTLASACRESLMLSRDITGFVPATLEFLCRHAGVRDNPSFPPVFHHTAIALMKEGIYRETDIPAAVQSLVTPVIFSVDPLTRKSVKFEDKSGLDYHRLRLDASRNALVDSNGQAVALSDGEGNIDMRVYKAFVVLSSASGCFGDLKPVFEFDGAAHKYNWARLVIKKADPFEANINHEFPVPRGTRAFLFYNIDQFSIGG